MPMVIDTQTRPIVPGTPDARDQSGALHDDQHLLANDLEGSLAGF